MQDLMFVHQGEIVYWQVTDYFFAMKSWQVLTSASA